MLPAAPAKPACSGISSEARSCAVAKLPSSCHPFRCDRCFLERLSLLERFAARFRSLSVRCRRALERLRGGQRAAARGWWTPGTPMDRREGGYFLIPARLQSLV